MPSLLALAAAFTFGVADFLGGLATRRASVLAVTLLSNFAGGLLAAVLVVVIDGRWSAGAVGWGGFGGLCGLVGLVLLYQALATGPNRVVSPLSAVVAAVVPVVAGLAAGERPTSLALIGLAIAPVAIWLVAGGDLRLDGIDRRPFLLAVGAGLGFGTFFVMLAQTADDAGAVPLLAARVVSLSVLIVAATVIRPSTPGRDVAAVALSAGALDMTANGLFLWSTIDGDLAVVGALVSLFPASTVLLAAIMFGERLNRSQLAGLGLALAAAALLS